MATSTIWESNSIVRYLAARYGKDEFYPSDSAIRSHAERWMDWQLSTLGTPMRDLFWGYVRTPPEKRDGAALQSAFDLACAAMRILDAKLAGSPYVAGDRFTMGDVPVGCFTYRWFSLPLDRPELPSLARWYESLQDKPGYRKHVMVTMTCDRSARHRSKLELSPKYRLGGTPSAFLNIDVKAEALS